MKPLTTKLLKLITVFLIALPMMMPNSAFAQDEEIEPDDLVDLTLPIEFEDDAVDWDYATLPFEGASTQRVENPDPSGINDSEYVLQYIKEGGEFWAGFFMHLEEDQIEITDESVATMKVWSHRADLEAMMKFEMQDADVESPELFAEITQEEEWIELEWDLDAVDQNTPWDVITIIMELEDGSIGDGGPDYTWFIDDIDVSEGDPTSSEDEYEVPGDFELSQNYPNPFNPTTDIEFALPEQAHVNLTVYNMLGQRVETIADQTFQQGTHTVSFDASGLPSGNYIYRLETENHVESKQMMLIK